jgi:ABC-2 type transport system permease protein
MPLVFSIALAQVALKNPDGDLAVFLSLFPLTSPIVFPVRAAFTFDVLHLILAVVFLIAAIVLITWIAARIYRTGILMYGKRISWKEVFRWMVYKP